MGQLRQAPFVLENVLCFSDTADFEESSPLDLLLAELTSLGYHVRDYTLNLCDWVHVRRARTLHTYQLVVVRLLACQLLRPVARACHLRACARTYMSLSLELHEASAPATVVLCRIFIVG